MISQDQEREVKFCILDRGALMGRIVDLGARLEHERTHELNLLRLRKNYSAFLTYKGSSWIKDGVFSRQEIEFEIGDFEAAKRLIESLGFRVVVIYEKYRTT